MSTKGLMRRQRAHAGRCRKRAGHVLGRFRTVRGLDPGVAQPIEELTHLFIARVLGTPGVLDGLRPAVFGFVVHGVLPTPPIYLLSSHDARVSVRCATLEADIAPRSFS